MSAKYYIRDTGDFLNKLKSPVKVPDNAILFMTDVVGLHPSISNKEEQLNWWNSKTGIEIKSLF